MWLREVLCRKRRLGCGMLCCTGSATAHVIDECESESVVIKS